MRLSTDNPDTMPITDSVYGKPTTGKPDGNYEPRGHTAKLWRRLSNAMLDTLADQYPKARRFAARRRSEDRFSDVLDDIAGRR